MPDPNATPCEHPEGSLEEGEGAWKGSIFCRSCGLKNVTEEVRARRAAADLANQQEAGRAALASTLRVAVLASEGPAPVAPITGDEPEEVLLLREVVTDHAARETWAVEFWRFPDGSITMDLSARGLEAAEVEEIEPAELDDVLDLMALAWCNLRTHKQGDHADARVREAVRLMIAQLREEEQTAQLAGPAQAMANMEPGHVHMDPEQAEAMLAAEERGDLPPVPPARPE